MLEAVRAAFSHDDDSVSNGGTARQRAQRRHRLLQHVRLGGRPLENALADDQGEYNSEYTDQRRQLLREGVHRDAHDRVGRQLHLEPPRLLDARYRSVSMADLFPEGYRRWLGNNLTGDDAIKGPRLA
jgi:hypothetical protein